MNKQVSRPYLELKKTVATSFVWQNEKHNLRNAPPLVFDEWIRQYVEIIKNVDTQEWDIFDRWQIVNAVLAEGIIEVVDADNGTFSLREVREAEEKTSSERTSELQLV